MNLSKRPRRRQTTTAVIRSWRSPEGRYSVEEVTSLIDGHRTVLVVETLPCGGQIILSRHRKRLAAAKAVEGFIKRSNCDTLSRRRRSR